MCRFFDELSTNIDVKGENRKTITAHVSQKLGSFRDIQSDFIKYKRELKDSVPTMIHKEFRVIMDMKLGSLLVRG